MSYITLGRSAFFIAIYLLGYFALDLKICFLLITAWFVFGSFLRKKNPEVKGGVVNFNRHHLPAWILHPDTERSEWINTIIQQLWPFLEAYIRDMLLALEKNDGLKASLKPYAVESISFPSFTLGSVPPRITGVKVHSTVHRREIIVDINLDYAGDSEISVLLGVSAPLSKVLYLHGGLKHISMRSSLRLHLAPLLRDTPFVGSVSLSFLDIPELDFILSGIVKVLDFPGIEALLKKFISNFIEEHYVNPNSLKIALRPIGDSSPANAFSSSRRLDEGEAHSLRVPKGVLRIKILEAKGLENKDVNLIGSSNKSDPYATLEVMADSHLHSFKTHVVFNNLHPSWNYTAELIIDDPESLDRMMIHIWDHDSSNKDDFLGKCELPLSEIKTAIQKGESEEFWTILEDVQRGSVHTLVSWSNLCEAPQLHLSEQNCGEAENIGVLVIEIDSCSNLLCGRGTGLKLPNPKVVVELCGSFQETEVVTGTIHPVFEHRMHFLISNPKVDSLKISVMDTRKSLRDATVLGTLRLNIYEFLLRKGNSLLNHQFNLKSRTPRPEKEPASIILSAAFRYIEKRAPSISPSSKRLQELHKKVTSSNSSNERSSQSPSPPAILLTPPKSHLGSRDDINNNSGPIGSVKSLINLNPSLNIPDLISVSQKYNLHLPNAKSQSSNGKFPDYRAKLRLSIKYNSMTKTLSVVVHQGKNIPVFPQSNVGVKLYLLEELPQRLIRRLKHGKRKTKAQKTPEPTFEETLEYYLPHNDLLTRKLEVVLDIRKGIRSRAVGQFIVDLFPLASNASLTKWYLLQLTERFEGVNDFPHKGLPQLKFSPTHSLKVFQTSNEV